MMICLTFSMSKIVPYMLLFHLWIIPVCVPDLSIQCFPHWAIPFCIPDFLPSTFILFRIYFSVFCAIPCILRFGLIFSDSIFDYHICPSYIWTSPPLESSYAQLKRDLDEMTDESDVRRIQCHMNPDVSRIMIDFLNMNFQINGYFL